jgi:hypothetical protein
VRSLLRSGLLLSAAALVACSGSEPPAVEPGTGATSEAAVTQPESARPSETETGSAADSADSAAPVATPTLAELRWSGRVARWSRGVVHAARSLRERIDEPASARAPLPQLQALRGCRAGLARQVGPAPTEELQELARELQTMCAGLRRLAALVPWAAGDEARDRVEDELARSFEIAETVGRKLEDYVPEEDAELPTLQGKAGHVSRSEPTFGDTAQLLVGRPVEIRCWSSSDWPRLTRRVQAYTGRPLPARDTGGFVLVTGRANLSPRICAQLVDLTYGPCEVLPCPRTYRPRGLRRRLELALAVVTLAHEAEHAVGVRNEAKAECRALQRAELAARTLGVESAYAPASWRST